MGKGRRRRGDGGRDGRGVDGEGKDEEGRWWEEEE